MYLENNVGYKKRIIGTFNSGTYKKLIIGEADARTHVSRHIAFKTKDNRRERLLKFEDSLDDSSRQYDNI